MFSADRSRNLSGNFQVNLFQIKGFASIVQFPGMDLATQGNGQAVVARIDFVQFEGSEAVRVNVGRGYGFGSVGRYEILFAERYAGVGGRRAVSEKSPRENPVGRFAARSAGMVFPTAENSQSKEKECEERQSLFHSPSPFPRIAMGNSWTFS